MNKENQLRESITRLGLSLYQRGYSCGSSGNISLKVEDGILITPTNTCLGTIDPAHISKIDFQGQHISGAKPSKEAFLHLSMYQHRQHDNAVVHLHSTYSVALSCCRHKNPDNVLPPITAYYIMKIGQLPMIPYFKPADKALAQAVAELAPKHHAMLLKNHGPVVSGKNLDFAAYAIEELEETAKLYFLLQSSDTDFLTQKQIIDLQKSFPS